MLFSVACHSGTLDLIPIADRNVECLPELTGDSNPNNKYALSERAL